MPFALELVNLNICSDFGYLIIQKWKMKSCTEELYCSKLSYLWVSTWFMTNILWLIFFWFRYWFMCGTNSFSSSNLFLYGTSIPSWWGPQSSFLFAFTPDNSKTPEKECDDTKNNWMKYLSCTMMLGKNTYKGLLCFNQL